MIAMQQTERKERWNGEIGEVWRQLVRYLGTRDLFFADRVRLSAQSLDGREEAAVSGKSLDL